MRKSKPKKRYLLPDPKFQDPMVTKFVNYLMNDGKKSVAQNVFYDAMDVIKQKMPDAEPIEVFTQAVENVKPAIEVRSKRVGGERFVGRTALLFADRHYDPADRQRLLADAVHLHRHLVGGAAELIAAYNREGAAMSRRENVHRMADANKAFAHFAW